MPIPYPTVDTDGRVSTEDHLTASELADLLHVSVRTVQRRVRGELWPHVDGGRHGPLFAHEHVAAIVRSRQHAYPPHDPPGAHRPRGTVQYG